MRFFFKCNSRLCVILSFLTIKGALRLFFSYKTDPFYMLYIYVRLNVSKQFIVLAWGPVGHTLAICGLSELYTILM